MAKSTFNRRFLWMNAMTCAVFSIAAMAAFSGGMVYQFMISGPITNVGLDVGWGMSLFAGFTGILTLFAVRDDTKEVEG